MCVSVPGSCEHKDYLKSMHDSAHGLGKQMVEAIKRNDVAEVEFLLKAGVPANTPVEIGSFSLSLMGFGLMRNLAIAKLLRKYRALFLINPVDDGRRSPEFGWSESFYSLLSLARHADVLADGAFNWLVDNWPVDKGSEPLPTYEHDRDATPTYTYREGGVTKSRCNPPRNVLTSWPPNVSLEGCTESMKKDIENFWYTVGDIRRIEAWHNTERNWRVFRLMMRMRGIAMFWMRVTQENGCKPEGVLCKRDREAYEEADMFS